MKKVLISCLLLCITNIFSQTIPPNVPNPSSIDDKLVNINKSSVTSGILYQRSGTFTNLYDFNKLLGFDKANYSFFEQSLNDLYYGSNQTKFISNDELRNRISTSKFIDNVVDIGIVNTSFHILNYNEDSPSTGGLLLDSSTNLFSPINGKPTFFELNTTVIAPLKKEAKGTTLTYNFRNDLFFTNGTKSIKNLTANLGDGISRNIISNGVFAPQNITVNYSTSGEKKLIFSITYSDNSTVVTNGTIYFQYSDIGAKTGMCNGETLADDFSITSDVAFKGYDELFAFRGKIDYRVFYRKDGTDRKIRKPIIIVDGFDPGDKRKIFACEMSNYIPNETFSIEDMMVYPKTVNGEVIRQNLIKELRDKGYDVTIVNHPTYSVSNVAPYNVVPNGTPNSKIVDGGADFIERNGLALATLIKNFNSQLKQNGSTEKLAIVGPSMGGQTSRYALAYMEKKLQETNDQSWNHNTRLWISVDSPHLGANIPLGDQAFLYLAANHAHSIQAKDMYYGMLNSPAAKQ